MSSFEKIRGDDELRLIQLVGMGFDEAVATKAFSQPGVDTVEAAINWIVSQPEEQEDDDEGEEEEELLPMKMVIICRRDLNMTPGKIASQCCHAMLGAYRLSEPKVRSLWENQGESTICLQVNSDEELEAILMSAIKNRLVVSVQHDAGRTEVEPMTRTCGSIGPDYNSKIDKVTKLLKLYK